MEKINVAELLKDCPKGMELDCTMFDNVTFYSISNEETIVAWRESVKRKLYLDKYGCPLKYPKGDLKCVIFPKGKTTWEGFQGPFKDGDIVATMDGSWIGITEGGKKGIFIPTYCVIKSDGVFQIYFDRKEKWAFDRLATEEEKEKLFQAIKENGYKWNAETKTLEKLIELKFKIGSWVVFNNQPEKGSIYQIKNAHNYEYTLQHILGGSMPIPFSKADMLRLWTIDDAKNGDVLVDEDNNIGIFQECEGMYWSSHVYLGCDDKLRGFSIGGSHKQTDVHPATKEQRDLLFQKIKEAGYKWNSETKTLEKLIKPIFKAGNKVRNKNNHNIVFTITSIEEDYYGCGAAKAFWFMDQDKFELVPNKFDITTLKPFDRVLVKSNITNRWIPSLFGCLRSDDDYPYVVIGGVYWKCCIPYEGNEHLLDTTDDCDEYYKTWE